MDLAEFSNQNIERFVELADAAEVLAVGFRLFPQRLIIDFRYDEIDPPMIKVAQRVTSAQERLRELAKSRPRSSTPVLTLNGWRPRPLDDGGAILSLT